MRAYNDGQTVERSFALAIERAAKLRPMAEPLIFHAALLDPKPIPLFLREELWGRILLPLVGEGGLAKRGRMRVRPAGLELPENPHPTRLCRATLSRSTGEGRDAAAWLELPADPSVTLRMTPSPVPREKEGAPIGSAPKRRAKKPSPHSPFPAKAGARWVRGC
jgi:hypothetical protein